MATKTQKIQKICYEIRHVLETEPVHFLNTNKSKPIYEVKLSRFRIKHIIQQTLNIIDAHSVNSWVNLLLSMKIIKPNPHTQLSSKKKLIKPSNDTLYVVDEEKIKKHTHISSQVNLSKFYEVSILPINNNGKDTHTPIIDDKVVQEIFDLK
jgi:hypothetical protein